MTNEPTSSGRPVAISFQEFRDGEIVDFFANENRTFHPDQAGDNFGRARLVGAPHFPVRQKGTAAFRASIQATEKKSDDRRKGVEREETADTIPLPTEILNAPPDVLAATITEPPKRRRNPESDPSFGKPTRPLGSVLGSRVRKPGQAASVVEDRLAKNEKQPPLTHGRPILVASLEDTPVSIFPEPEIEASENVPVEKSLLARLRNTDEQLERLIETWPRLSSRLRETIAALVEVGEKDSAESNAE